jgi:hypothetical protein
MDGTVYSLLVNNTNKGKRTIKKFNKVKLIDNEVPIP